MNSNLTVVVPLYNQEKYIRQCLESILSQTIDGLSVIVVNDGSTDGSLDICEELAEKDSRLRIITQKNQGLAGARMAGLRVASSNYVTFVDADDFILENAYECAVEYMDSGIDEIMFEISRYYEDGRTRHEELRIREGVYSREQIRQDIFPHLVWNFERKIPGIECSQCVRIVKTELLKDAYKWLGENRFYYGEDIAITYPLLTRINSMAVIPKSFYMHRQRASAQIPSYISSKGFFDEAMKLANYLRDRMDYSITQYDFTRQIDYFFVYSCELKKMCYGDYQYARDYVFPFDKVPPKKNVILYGAGDMGRTFYAQLVKIDYCNRLIWVDKNAEALLDSRIDSLSVLDEEESMNADWIVIAIENKVVHSEVRKYLIEKRFSEKMII